MAGTRGFEPLAAGFGDQNSTVELRSYSRNRYIQRETFTLYCSLIHKEQSAMRSYYKLLNFATLIVLVWILCKTTISKIHISDESRDKIAYELTKYDDREMYKKLDIGQRFVVDFLRWYTARNDNK